MSSNSINLKICRCYTVQRATNTNNKYIFVLNNSLSTSESNTDLMQFTPQAATTAMIAKCVFRTGVQCLKSPTTDCLSANPIVFKCKFPPPKQCAVYWSYRHTLTEKELLCAYSTHTHTNTARKCQITHCSKPVRPALRPQTWTFHSHLRAAGQCVAVPCARRE